MNLTPPKKGKKKEDKGFDSLKKVKDPTKISSWGFVWYV